MAEQQGTSPDSVPPPVGTLFVLTLYLALIAGMWGAMLWGLIGR
jgi:hypothetical protein